MFVASREIFDGTSFNRQVGFAVLRLAATRYQHATDAERIVVYQRYFCMYYQYVIAVLRLRQPRIYRLR